MLLRKKDGERGRGCRSTAPIGQIRTRGRTAQYYCRKVPKRSEGKKTKGGAR